MDVGDKLARVVIAGEAPRPRRVSRTRRSPTSRGRSRGGLPGARAALAARRIETVRSSLLGPPRPPTCASGGLAERRPRGLRPRGCCASATMVGVAMRTDCKHYESRTYASGEAVRKCTLDLAPEAPWRCPVDCPKFERRMIDVGWQYGSLTKGMEPSPPEPEEMSDDVARPSSITPKTSSTPPAPNCSTSRERKAQEEALPQAQEALPVERRVRFVHRLVGLPLTLVLRRGRAPRNPPA